MAETTTERTTWYRTRWTRDDSIDEIPVLEETRATLVVADYGGRTRRVMKTGHSVKHFRTRSEALDYLVSRKEQAVRVLRARLADAEEKLARLTALQNVEPPDA